MEGRPTRTRVIHGSLNPTHEDLAIVTLLPMPQGNVVFINVRDVLWDFLHTKRIAVTAFSKCPFGQAYVRFDSVADRDFLLNKSPHLFDDIHVIFQKHNEGPI